MACCAPNECSTEEEILNRFLNDLYERKIRLQKDEEEQCDIRNAVTEMVNNISTTVTAIDPKFRIGRKLLVGSASERTQIVQPNEYDFQLVLEELSDAIDPINVSDCVEKPGCVHIPFKNDASKDRWIDLLADEKLVSTRGGKMGAIQAGFRQQFHKILQHATDLLKKAHIEMKTGILLMQNSTIRKHGPAFTPSFVWQRKASREKMEIFVDLCPVIRFTGNLDKLIRLQDVTCETYFDYVHKIGHVMLMPCTRKLSCESGLCFRVIFTPAEILLIRDMSNHHRKCYKLLKYILNGILARTATVFHSYALKTLVLNHHYLEKCEENQSVSKCFMSLLRQIQGIIEDSPVSLLRYDMRKHLPNMFLNKVSVWNHEQSILDGDIQIRLKRLMKRLKKIASMTEYDFQKCYIRSVNCSNLNKVYIPIGFILYEALDHLFEKQ